MNNAKTFTNNQSAYDSYSLLASDVSVCNNTRVTGINNNVLVIGPSGCGKTRSYVMPNILQTNTSMIVSDAKGTLYGECGDYLRKRGYKVHNIDLVDLSSTVGYNPLNLIRRDPVTGKYNEQDIIKLSEIVIMSTLHSDPFWDMAARMYLQSLVAYTLETTPECDHTLTNVNKLMCAKGGNTFEMLMSQHMEQEPDSLSVKRYEAYKTIGSADKMIGSILGIVSTNLSSFVFDGLNKLYNMPEQVDFSCFGREKVALFLSVSDTDRSLDRLANLFWTQALQALCFSADKDYPDHRFKMPVRLYLDDFATNVYIPDFDKISSNIRSREIYCSIILQSLSQLEALYGSSKASTILGNCDQQLVLGIQDADTAGHFSVRADMPLSYMLNMPLDRCYVFLRGQKAKATTKYDVTRHEAYHELKSVAAEEAAVEQPDVHS